MTILVLSTLLFCLAQASTDFDQWAIRYGKIYPSLQERRYRMTIWEQNRYRIERHNSQDGQSYRLGLNRFADLTFDEFSRRYLMARPLKVLDNLTTPSLAPLFQSVNWNVNGFVPEVQNQGECGSCWAFSSAETLSAHFAIWYGRSAPTLSPQELVDCVPFSYSCYGCEGGWPSRAMEFALDSLGGGLERWSGYTYTGTDGPCSRHNLTNSTIQVHASKVVNVTAGSQNELLLALYQHGPVSICIDVTDDFQFYQDGIYKNTQCSTTLLNHAILLYGLYRDPVSNRWAYMVRNSWGLDTDGSDTGWGDHGDIFLDASVMGGNICGITSAASYVKWQNSTLRR